MSHAVNGGKKLLMTWAGNGHHPLLAQAERVQGPRFEKQVKQTIQQQLLTLRNFLGLELPLLPHREEEGDSGTL